VLEPKYWFPNNKSVHAALDVLYGRSNDFLCSRADHSELEAFIREMDVRQFTVDQLIGLLTISSWVKSEIPSRPGFFKRVAEELLERGYLDVQDILRGLE
jgi:hypothetical protein